MNMLISNSIRPYTNDHRLKNNISCFRQGICITLCLLLSGCASFSDRPIRRHKVKLHKDEISKISGTYQLFPDLTYKKNGVAETLRYQPITEHFHQYISKRGIYFKPSENVAVDVMVIDNNQIRFHFKKDSIIVDSVTLSARLQSRGLIAFRKQVCRISGSALHFRRLKK